MQDRDFEEWVRLAAEQPDHFETQRKTCVEAFIRAQPGARQQQLRRLQWRIDRERERAPTALAACQRISQMMWERFAGDNGLAERLAVFAGQRSPSSPRRKARVLIFPRRR